MSSIGQQVGGDHYRQGKIQPVEYIEANSLGFLEGCCLKRITRHNRPGGKGRQDIEKAIHELQLLLELRYGNDGHSAMPATKVTEHDWIKRHEGVYQPLPGPGVLVYWKGRDGVSHGPVHVEDLNWDWGAKCRNPILEFRRA